MADAVRYELASGVASIRLSSTAGGNALDAAMIRDLHRSLTAADSEPGCRVIVLSSAGDAFCSGLSLPAAFESDQPLDAGILAAFVDCLSLLCRTERPVIACVEGEVTGGGVGLVAACDLVIASDAASFALPEVTVGLLPALVMPFILRRLSPARARALCLSSRRIAAREAQIWGLVDELAGDQMDRVLHRQIQRLLRSSPAALARCKRYLDELNPIDQPTRAQMGLELASEWVRRPEVVAGIQDLLAGRPLPWSQTYRRPDDVDRD